MKEYYIDDINIIESDCDNPVIILIHLHGYGGHFQHISYNYDDFYERDKYFSKFNIKSYALEFASHGKSKKKFNSINDFLDNINTLINHINTNLPIYILSESMSSAVAIKYDIIYNKINGLICMAPMIDINYYKILCNIIPHFLYKISPLETSIDEIYIKNKKKYSSSFNYKLLIELIYLNIWIYKYGHIFNKKIFILHSTNDNITNYKSSINYYNIVNSKQKKIKLFTDCYHALLLSYKAKYILYKIKQFILC